MSIQDQNRERLRQSFSNQRGVAPQLGMISDYFRAVPSQKELNRDSEPYPQPFVHVEQVSHEEQARRNSLSEALVAAKKKTEALVRARVSGKKRRLEQLIKNRENGTSVTSRNRFSKKEIASIVDGAKFLQSYAESVNETISWAETVSPQP